LPFIPTRVTALAHFLATQLASLRHSNGTPAARVLSRVPGWIDAVGSNGNARRRLARVHGSGGFTIPEIGDAAEWEDEEDRDNEGTGGTVSFVMLEVRRVFIELYFI
jgi:hypothetical protein